MSYDFLIIGTGIIGLSIAREIRSRHPGASVAMIEKEPDVARHGSGRNSGVLHAGFYYTADSLKAKFTQDGCRQLKDYCRQHGLKLNPCQKVVVTQDESELPALYELARRGQANGVDLKLIGSKELADIEPNARTFEKALHSPTTATVDPIEICRTLQGELMRSGVQFFFQEAYHRRLDANSIATPAGKRFTAAKIINAAGLYADKIAKDFGFGRTYTIIPFKGIYLKYTRHDTPIRTNIYPVPNLNNPFLGVHYTVTVDGHIKIGPTAIPAFWRENYSGATRFKLDELVQVLGWETRLFIRNAFGFRNLAFEEMKKYSRNYFTGLAANMVHRIDPTGFTSWTRPGIRAQLLDTQTLKLVQDFVVESDRDSVHILNAVSPAFTSSFPFAAWVVDKHL